MIDFNTFLSNFSHVNTFKLINSGNYIIVEQEVIAKLKFRSEPILATNAFWKSSRNFCVSYKRDCQVWIGDRMIRKNCWKNMKI